MKKRRKEGWKANWIGHALHRSWPLIHVTEGTVEGRIEVTRRQGRRRKQLLNYLKEKARYCRFKDEALDRTVWRTALGKDTDLS